MSVVVRAHDEPVASRLERVRHVVGDTVIPLEIRPRSEPGMLHYDLRADIAGVVKVAQVDEGPGEAARTPGLVSRSDPEVYQLLVRTRGVVLLEQDGRSALLRPGGMGLMDSSRPFRCAHSRMRATCLTFPKTGPALPRNDVAALTGTRIPARRGSAAVATSLIRHLPHALAGCDEFERDRLGDLVLDLLNTALTARLGRDGLPPPTSRRRALLAPIYAYINEHLGGPDLRPATIAAAQHISLRYLHKLFEGEDRTVSGWIRHCRLERCRRDLRNPRTSALPVGTIEARWGFTDAAGFSRLFRAAYGVPPSRYRDRPPADG